MAPKIKVTYFDMKGRAEWIRLTLVAGGIEFEDERINREELMKRKPELPFGSLPVMEVDGEVLAESNALVRYAGRLAGLYPEDALEACRVDMIVDVFETIIMALYKDNSAEARAKFVEETVPRYFGKMEAEFAKKEGPYLLGEKMSIADIKLSVVMWMLSNGMIDHVPTDVLNKYKSLVDANKAVLSNEKISKWNAEH